MCIATSVHSYMKELGPIRNSMRRYTAAILSLCVLTITAFGADLPDKVRSVLRAAPATAHSTWTAYNDKYATKTSGEAERKDRESKWAELKAYANALWEVEKVISVGQSISDYPGILSHGTIKWDDAAKSYALILGLRPFNAGDGLGQFSVGFDLAGRITSKERFKYAW